MNYIRWFDTVGTQDVGLVGGKNASLGQMIQDLSGKGIRIPFGFAITAQAYWHVLQSNNLVTRIEELLKELPSDHSMEAVQKVGSSIRQLIEHAELPSDLTDEIIKSYQELSQKYGVENLDVAVRSSATAEDLPTASFAGQQESYLNVSGAQQLLEHCRKCFASLFTDRAIVYRIEQGFDHMRVALSICVQKMVRADLGVSGVAFSLEPESGFRDVVTINAAYGLGESIVQGRVIPDEYMVFKTTMDSYRPIVKKYCGDKAIKIIYAHNHQMTEEVSVDKAQQQQFSLTDDEIMNIAQSVVIIEEYYSDVADRWVAMDVEWAKDGRDGQIYIVQARPETVHARYVAHELTVYKIDVQPQALNVLTTGRSIGQKIVSGKARIIKNIQDIQALQPGEILITDMTDPDWLPAMKMASGIITNKGGRTCHAAIVSRELGIQAIVGTYTATETIEQGQTITLDCSRGEVGYVYEGAVPYTQSRIALNTKPNVPVDIMVNLADPDGAWKTSMLPVSGVGLARMEFIITNSIKIHPMALIHPERITDQKVIDEIDQLTAAYSDKKQFFIEVLARGIGMIAAAFYPRPVIVRLSDFKSNEYRNLIGGQYFEPQEENPMIGFRGACRYNHEMYKEGFALECAALAMARRTMGLKNIKIMVPFVRTTKEACSVIQALCEHGLKRGDDELNYIMMCEVPSNVILIDEFARYFDGFSIGSNDLTQLTLGVDRDSALLASEFDERDPAVLRMMKMAIVGAHAYDRSVGICGQAPSDYPDIAEYLIDLGIDSISLNPDSVLPFVMKYM
jgi:pyruvate,water dikinase